MVSSWPIFVSECKSRLSAIARSCFFGRAIGARSFVSSTYFYRRCVRKVRSLRHAGSNCNKTTCSCGSAFPNWKCVLAQPQTVQLPLGDVPGGQQYAAGMIALCVNLARKVGLRPTEHALHVVFDWLGVKVEVPTYQTIRLWMQCISLDRMENATKMAGGVSLTDHTNQIGKEKVLVMLRVPEATGHTAVSLCVMRTWRC